MDWCICRKSTKCEDYPIELGCLFLGEATLKIDPRLGHRATKQEALEHVQKCRDAGLVHLIGRNKLDSVWLNAQPGNNSSRSATAVRAAASGEFYHTLHLTLVPRSQECQVSG